MFKKLLVASVVFAAGTGLAFAGHSYKGESDYKGEAPCPTYQYTAGPYLGLSVGPQVNLLTTPAVNAAFSGTISAGYAAMLNPSFYLAGEIFGGDSANLKDYPNQNGASARSTWTYGLDILPGYMITDYVLAYLRAGVVRTRFNNISENKTGWQVGLGGQTNIYQNWDLRAEYVYSQYSNISNVGRPMSNQFNVGVIYKFV